MMLDGMGDPFGSAVLSLSPPSFPHTPPTHSLAGQCEKQKGPGGCASAAQQSLEHPCVTHAVFITVPKHSLIPATVEKINSLPAKTSTAVISTPPHTNVGQGKEHNHGAAWFTETVL